MNIEKLLFAIFLSLLTLLGISIIGVLIVGCIIYFISIEQYSNLIVIISFLILFICLVCYFYKTCE